MMEKRALSAIGVLIHHQTADLLLRIADLCRERHGAAIHLFAASDVERAHYEGLNDGRWASVTSSDVMAPALAAALPDEEAVVRRARRIEDRLGLAIGGLVLGHRHLGRGFSPLGTRLPMSPRFRNVGHLNVLHAYAETLEFWERELSGKGITLLLQGTKEAMVVARSLGIANRRLSVARYKDRWYWAHDEFQSWPALERAYRHIVSAPAPDLDRPYGMNLRKRADTERRRLVGFALRSSIVNLAYWLYGLRRWRREPRTLTLNAALIYPWQRLLAHRRAERILRTRLSDLAGRPFVYVPLQKEPEAAFHLRSPEYFHQHAMIMSLARDVPAGVVVAVKETLSGIEQRPRGFYRQLEALRNVVLLDPHEPGMACAKAAAVTAVIVGTAGLEAAILGRPVITYGRHGLYNFLPHVMTVTDEAQLAAYLRRVFDGKIDEAQARSDGARFLAALVSCSFDTGKVLRGDDDPQRRADVAARALDALVETLQEAPRSVAAE